jgi:2-keto-4-pentenoate hydratase/2-oxohepta-3-ene-1,7-dioic acid hydratase in catechol pathway
MRLCTVRTPALEPFFGIEVGRKILRIAAAAEACRVAKAQRPRLATMGDYLQALPRSEKTLRTMLQHMTEDPSLVAGNAADGNPFLVPAESVTYLPPVANPSKILCVGLNYRDHCEEQGKDIPTFPIIFNKFPSSLIGHGAEIPMPLHIDTKIDFEGELAFVVGTRATRVKARQGLKHVAGLMVMNDVSARGLQYTEKQWARAKGFDGSGPCGPCLVTLDEIADPHNLAITTRVNGKVMQTSSTRHLIFRIGDLIQHITAAITLEPGDIVTTGTPGGVGVFREPPVFLRKGDIVEIDIETVGRLRNTCGEA